MANQNAIRIFPIEVHEPEVSKKFKFAWVLLHNIFECLGALDKKPETKATERIRQNTVPSYMVFTNSNQHNAVPLVTDLV